VLVVQEARAKGILTRTLVAAVALIDMVAVGVFVFMAAFQSEGTSWIEALLHVGVEFGITFAIGSACSLIGIALTRTIVGPAFLGPIMVAVILASWGLANVFSVTGILSCTFAGIVLSNVSHDSVRSTEAYLQTIGAIDRKNDQFVLRDVVGRRPPGTSQLSWSGIDASRRCGGGIANDCSGAF
jgi:NhaP-type Na+/H+ or K+/H+ antiporter